MLARGSVGWSNTCHYPLKGHRQGKRIKSVGAESILLGVLTALACRGKTKRTWLEFSGSNFGLYILLRCLYMCTLDLQSKIRVTICYGPTHWDYISNGLGLRHLVDDLRQLTCFLGCFIRIRLQLSPYLIHLPPTFAHKPVHCTLSSKVTTRGTYTSSTLSAHFFSQDPLHLCHCPF